MSLSDEFKSAFSGDDPEEIQREREKAEREEEQEYDLVGDPAVPSGTDGDGKPVDQYGNHLDAEGHRVDDHGFRIDRFGNRIGGAEG